MPTIAKPGLVTDQRRICHTIMIAVAPVLAVIVVVVAAAWQSMVLRFEEEPIQSKEERR